MLWRCGLMMGLCGAIAFPCAAVAQGTAADYARMERLGREAGRRVLHERVRPEWSPSGDRLLFRHNDPQDDQTTVVVDVTTGRRVSFTPTDLALQMQATTGTVITLDELARLEYHWSANDTLYYDWQHWRWTVQLEPLRVSPGLLIPPAPALPEALPNRRRGRRDMTSPDGRWQVRLRDHNLQRIETATGQAQPLTTDGTSKHFYEGRGDWSPDSRWLIVWRTISGDEHWVHLIESSPRDQVEPKQHKYFYHKPGDRLPITKPVLMEIATGRVIAIDDALFPSPWSLTAGAWSADSRRFTFVDNERGHQTLRLIEVTVPDGSVRVLIDEQSPTFIDYAYKQYLHRMDETHEAIWMSERDGWNHLYLYDLTTGAVKQQITNGEWVVRGVDRVDETKRQIWFRAGGIDPQQDPYHVLYCRINFDGSGLVILTPGDGTHEVEYSPDGRFLIDRYSRVDLPPVTELRRSEDGSLVCELERADITDLEKLGWKMPQRFVTAGRDGKTPIYGVIFRPTNFDPAKKYPVVEQIYAGPHGSFVPKSFRAMQGAQALAELGFITVQIDGMGTSNRSKAFHDVAWKNLGDAGFPDRLLWMQAAAKAEPVMDLSRVGIYGGSAGGQSTVRGLLMYPDFYKVGVADCGCHDNRMDKVWWNELWMGYPVGPHYAEQSNVTQAHRLQGKLLLVVGELDRNVDPASTMQVVDALIRADKDFDLLVIPGAGHGAAESPYGKRRRADFLVRHLLHIEPRHE